MATYPITYKPSFSYEDFLMHNQYVGDITNGIKKASTDVVKAQAMSAKILNDTINKNGEFISNTLDSGFGEISKDITSMSNNFSTGIEKVSENFEELNNNLDYGFNRLDNSMGNISTNISTLNSGISMLNDNLMYALDEISSDIQNFHSDFNIAMGGIALQFEMQRKEMQEGFNSIINILENKRKTDAQEDFRDGIEFYNDGYKFPDKPIWFKNAHKHLTASIQKYDRNPLAHLHLAHIYHYQKDFRDFDKALEHYELCCTYAEADEQSYAIAAQGYFYAGWLKASVFEDIDSAINLTKKSIEFDVNFSQAYYNLAKFYAIKKDSSNSLKYLETAIVKFDRNYTVKSKLDSDFSPIEQELDKLLLKLKEDTHKKALQKWQKLKQEIDSYEIAPSDYQKISSYLTKIENYLNTKYSYFDNLDLLSIISKCKKNFDSLRLKERDEFKKEIFEAINLLDDGKEYDDEFLDLKDGASLKLKPGTFADAQQLYNILHTPVGKDFVEFLGHNNDINSIAFSPNGKYIASGSDDKTVRVWDIKSKREIVKFVGHSDTVYSVAFSPDGKYIASGSRDKAIRVWDIESKKEIMKLLGHTDYVVSVAFSPDGKYIASAGANDQSVIVWDVIKEQEATQFSGHSDYVKSVAFSPDGKYIASGSSDKTIRIWDITSKQEIVNFSNHKDFVESVAFSPNGKYIAAALFDTIRIWDIENKKEIVKFVNNSSFVHSVIFSPDGKYIAFAPLDRIVRIRNIKTKQEIKIFSDHKELVSSVAFSPNGKYIAFNSSNYSIKVSLLIDKLESWKILKEQREIEEIERIREQHMKERILKAKMLREQEAREKERLERKNLLDRQKNWRDNGQCEICGTKLGFFDKLSGQLRCKEHRN